MDVEELLKQADDLRGSLARISMKRYARRLDNSAELKATKKDLARVLTILGEKRATAIEGEGHGRA